MGMATTVAQRSGWRDTSLQGLVAHPTRAIALGVLEILGRRARLLTMEQLARLLELGAVDASRAGLAWTKSMGARGLVQRYEVMALRPAEVRVLATFRLGGVVPDFRELSKALRARSTRGALEHLTVARLGKRGEKLLGLQAPRVVRRTEGTHDLQLAEFAVQQYLRGGVADWLSETALAKERAYYGVLPDAEVVTASGERWVVECGGNYSAQRLARFHQVIVPQLEPRGVHGYVIV